jgi:serine O-acetyltransferase
MFKTMRNDVSAVLHRDPAARNAAEVIFLYPGLHALWLYRIAHGLWRRGHLLSGRWISQFARWLTGIEIHPGAKIGPGLFIDHGMATVIGETAEIGAYVTLYHNVTLGGVSLEKVKRHPTLEDHVVVGAGAQVLGPITIGAHSRIGANSVVVKDVPAHSVVVGVPGRVIISNGKPLANRSGTQEEDLHHDRLPDPTADTIRNLTARVVSLEATLNRLEATNGFLVGVDDVWVDAGGSHI